MIHPNTNIHTRRLSICCAVVLLDLQKRVQEQRKKAFDEAQRKALADASAALQAATAANANGNGSSKKAEASSTAGDSVIVTAQDVAGALPGSGSSSPGKVAAGGSSGGSSKPAPGKAELEARVAYLQEAAKSYDDPGMYLGQNMCCLL